MVVGLVMVFIVFLSLAAVPIIFPNLHADIVGHFVSARLDDYEGWTYYGKLLTQLGHHEPALFAFNKAVSIRPDYTDAWEKMGDLFMLMGEVDSAAEAYRMARGE